MTLPAFLLRCLLALALVAGGVPTFGMASDVAAEHPATAMTGCHDMAAPDSGADDVDTGADCCGSTDCLCDCLQHMPAAALAVWMMATPAFPATAPAPGTFARISRLPSATLRPPIA